MSQYHIPRKSNNRIPIKWTPVYCNKQERFLYRCPSKIRCVDGHIYRCKKLCRPNEIQSHINSKKHVYDFGNPELNGQLVFTNDLSHFRMRIINALSRLAACIDISCIAASSPGMFKFIHECIYTGLILGKYWKDCQMKDIESLFVKCSEKSIAENIKKLADSSFNEDLQIAKRIRYLSMKTDAGSVLGFHCFHSIVSAPKSSFSLLLDVYENRNFTADDYRQYFLEQINFCFNNNIQIVALVHDNFRPQCAGIKELLFIQEEDSNFKSIIDLRCMAHNINLVFINGILKNEKLKPLIDKVLRYSVDLRKPEAIGINGVKCPTISPTRWIYIFDQLLFMIKNIDVIEDYFGDDFKNFKDNFKFLYELIRPIKVYSLAVESDDTTLYESFEWAEYLLKKLKNLAYLYSQYSDDIANIIREFLARTISNQWHFINLSYLLTFSGRMRVRKSENKPFGRTENMEENHFYSPVINIDKEENKFQKMVDNDIEFLSCFKTFEEDENFIEKESTCVEVTIDASNLSEESYFESLQKLKNIPMCELFEYSIDKEMYVLAESGLRKYCAMLKLDERECVKSFDSWLFSDPQQFRFKIYDTEYVAMWKKIKMYQEWKSLAEIALRLGQISTSESQVERLLSKQKHVMGTSKTNLGTKMLESRLRLSGKFRNLDESNF